MMSRPAKWVVALVVLIVGISAVSICAWVLWHRLYQRPYTDESLRQQWTSDGTLARLRMWSQPYLGTNKPLPPYNQWPQTNPAVCETWAVTDSNKTTTAIAFSLGGADNGHGIVIGSAPPADFPFPVRSQWSDDVWWFDEVPVYYERK
jgi:hypothetical protein